MIKRRLIIMAVFVALIAAPILGQQYTTNQAAGAQVMPNPSAASSMNANPVNANQATAVTMNATQPNVNPISNAATGARVNITNVSFQVDEWVMIANQGSAPVNLNGWVLTDNVRFRYIFPAEILPVGGAMRIHFGSGFDVGQDVFLDLAGEMLPDTGDVIMLYDSAGTLVSRYAYPGVVQAQQVLPTEGVAFPGTEVQPVIQVPHGVLVAPPKFSPASSGQQILPNATSTEVTQIANVSAIFETNQAFNINITNVAVTGDQFIQVTNQGIVPANLTGWNLTAGYNFAYTFPQVILPVGGSIRVHPGSGMSTPTDLYLNLAGPVLDESAGVVTLYNTEGVMIARYTYPAGPSGLAATPGMIRAPGTAPVLFGNATPAVTTGPSPSGEAFLQAPVQALPNATMGQVQQVITG